MLPPHAAVVEAAQAHVFKTALVAEHFADCFRKEMETIFPGNVIKAPAHARSRTRRRVRATRG